LPFHQIDKAYKGYKFMININTVKTSPTMYARRVYEGLASGTPIISNYSLGMEKQFGDLIGYSENEDDLESYLNRLIENESEYNRIKQLGIRRVLLKHTYTQRLHQIAEKIGYELKIEDYKVTFVSFVDNEKDAERITEIFNRLDHPNKNLLIFMKPATVSYSFVRQKVTVLNEDDTNKFFMTFNQMIETDFIAPIKKDDFYGDNYLRDLLLANEYASAEVIGKRNYYVNEEGSLKEVNSNSEHEYTEEIDYRASIINSRIFINQNIDETLEYLKGERALSELRYLGINLYSSDKMNYVKNGWMLDENNQNKVTV